MLLRSWQWLKKFHILKSFWTPYMVVNTSLSSQHLVSRHCSNHSNFLWYHKRLCAKLIQVLINNSFLSFCFYVHIFVLFWNSFQLAWRSKLSWTAICIHTSGITWERSELSFIPSFWNLTRVWQLKPWQKRLEYLWILLMCKWMHPKSLGFSFLAFWLDYNVVGGCSLHIFVSRELSRFIAAGKLHCKIDKVAGVLETNRPDAKNALY